LRQAAGPAIIASMSSRRPDGQRDNRQRLTRMVGRAISRFQEASYAFDDVAAEILALNRKDLPGMTALLFNGPASAEELAAALHVSRSGVTATVERLQLAGYARVQPGASSRSELTAHARQWIHRIRGPLAEEG